MIRALFTFLGLAVLTSGVGQAQTVVVIDFNALSDRQVITDDFLSSHGVTFSTTGPQGIAVLFDTGFDHSTVEPDPNLRDDDLEGPGTPHAPWLGGNLPDTTPMGNALIIEEQNTDTDGDDLINANSPDDAGSGGTITIDFGGRYLSAFGWDFVDLEGPASYSVAFLDISGGVIDTITFDEFEAGGAYDQAAVWGDHTVNRIALIQATDLAGAPQHFHGIRYTFGGSGGIPAISWSVPEPGSMALIGLAALCGLVPRRRRED